MTPARGSFNVVSIHDGSDWLDDELVEGDFGQRVIELLGGMPEKTKELIPGMVISYHLGTRSVLVMTFPAGTDRAEAEAQMSRIRSGRDDTN